MKTNNKVLYFEGAAMDHETNEHSNVGNYRIRTAFTNNDSVQYYIELGRATRREQGKNGKYKVVSEWALRVDYLFSFEDMKKHDEAEEYNRKLYAEYRRNNLNWQEYENKKVVVPSGYKKIDHQEVVLIDYTKEGITAWINNNLNCNFDTIEVLNMFHGYRVRGDNKSYNLIENHKIDHELAEKRKQAYNEADTEYRSLCNSKYSVIGLLEMDNDSITIRCHASKEGLGNNPRVKTIKTA